MPDGAVSSEAVTLTRALETSFGGRSTSAFQVIFLLLPGARPVPTAPLTLAPGEKKAAPPLVDTATRTVSAELSASDWD